MHSPIEYDREGRAVGGGWNSNTTNISCGGCGERWYGGYTDLERAQGVPIKWERRSDEEKTAAEDK